MVQGIVRGLSEYVRIVERNGNNATYHGEATGPAGTVVTKKLTNPHAFKDGGPPLLPFIKIAGNKIDADAHRVRVDCARTVNFNNPKVTVLPRAGWRIRIY
jgi:hypothetical protein